MYVKVKPLRLFPYSAEGEGLRRATGSALGDEDPLSGLGEAALAPSSLAGVRLLSLLGEGLLPRLTERSLLRLSLDLERLGDLEREGERLSLRLSLERDLSLDRGDRDRERERERERLLLRLRPRRLLLLLYGW
jgi:hypothetical protein